MDGRTCGRWTLILVVVAVSLVGVGTGAVAACDTCADPNDEEPDREAFWGNDDFPYDTDENTSFVDIVVEETRREMEEDLGGENETREANVGAAAAAGGASGSAEASVAAHSSSGDGSAAVAVGASTSHE